MDVVTDMLRAIRSRYQMAVINKEIYLGSKDSTGKQFYAIHNREVAEWIDTTRAEIIKMFSEICDEAGIPKLHFPHFHRGRFW